MLSSSSFLLNILNSLQRQENSSDSIQTVYSDGFSFWFLGQEEHPDGFSATLICDEIE
jgi:hypothetical protein